MLPLLSLASVAFLVAAVCWLNQGSQYAGGLYCGQVSGWAFVFLARKKFTLVLKAWTLASRWRPAVTGVQPQPPRARAHVLTTARGAGRPGRGSTHRAARAAKCKPGKPQVSDRRLLVAAPRFQEGQAFARFLGREVKLSVQEWKLGELLRRPSAWRTLRPQDSAPRALVLPRPPPLLWRGDRVCPALLRRRQRFLPAPARLRQEKEPLSASAPTGGGRAAAAAAPGSPCPACLSFQPYLRLFRMGRLMPVTANWDLPPTSLVQPGNSASARVESTAWEPQRDTAGTGCRPSKIGGRIPSLPRQNPTPVTLLGAGARARRVPDAHPQPLPTSSFPSSQPVELATEQNLQMERSLRAKLTVGGGQTLEPQAQTHQEQCFALHRGARPSRGYPAPAGASMDW